MRSKIAQRKARIARELLRKGLHFAVGLTLSLLLYFGVIELFIVGLIALMGAALSFVASKREVALLSVFLRHVERENEVPGWGAVTLVAGIFLAFLVFPLDVALLAALAVTIIDSTATILGVMVAPDEKRKSLYASLAGGIIFFGVVSSFFGHIPLQIAGVAAIVGALTEYFYRFVFLDDNVAIPIVVGAVLSAILFIPLLFV